MKRRLFSLVLILTLVVTVVPMVSAANTAVRVLVEPILEFDEIGIFNEGVAPVRIGNKWGVIDKAGEIVVPIEYGWIYAFSEGLALANIGGEFSAVSMEETGVVGGTWGFIDKTGNVVIPFGHDFEAGSGSFHNGMAAVKNGDKWGYIDKTGAVVLPIIYEWAFDFSEGYGVVRKGYRPNPQFIFIDTDGNEVLTLEYSFVDTLSEGLAVAYKGWASDALYGYIDKTGKEVIPFEYDYTTPFSEGFALVGKVGGNSQIIDNKGNVITTLDALYWAPSKFIDGLLVVVTDDWEWGIIDTSGNIVVPFGLYTQIDDFSEGLAIVRNARNENGFINKKGDVMVSLQYTIARPFSEGLAAVTIGLEKWAILELTNEETVLDASEWAREGIAEAIAKGFVPTEIQYNYTDVITRSEFCRMAVKFVEHATGRSIDAVLAERELSRDLNAFTDTNDPDILAAFALGITSGTGGGLFTPNGQFSREQAATMIRNTCGVIGMDTSSPQDSGFADMEKASSWAVDGINFVRENGIMQGTGGNNFSPSATYTREQSIITFNNIKLP